MFVVIFRFYILVTVLLDMTIYPFHLLFWLIELGFS